jgi:CubicO group peptidase (beta-lactamase class C family)
MRIARLVALALLCGVMVFGHAAAQTGQSAPATLDPVALEAFFDTEVEKQRESHPGAGMAVVVATSNGVVFEKGYGFADVESGVPVDPETTMFPIASISKVFTWVAVLQLVEQGKLDLQADLRLYLRDLERTVGFRKPVTLNHLMSHTAGFERRQIGENFADPSNIPPLSQSVVRAVPAQVREPGEAATYSNWGAALAGLIVERASGVRFEDYVDANIVQRLGMTSTTARQSLVGFEGRQSQSYRLLDGRLERFNGQLSAPSAGGVSASPSDIGRLMQALLNGGATDKGRILGAETTELLFEPVFSPDPALPSIARGLMEQPRKTGPRLVGHTGTKATFHGAMMLAPERGVGIFVVYNTGRPSNRAMELVHAFYGRYFPTEAPLPDLKAASAPLDDPGDLTGNYRPTRRNVSRIEAAYFSLPRERSTLVERDDTGRLTLRRGDERSALTHLGNDLFRDTASGEGLKFVRARGGAPTYLYLEGDVTEAMERVPWFATAELHRRAQPVLVGLLGALGVIELTRLWRTRARPAVDKWPSASMVLSAAASASLWKLYQDGLRQSAQIAATADRFLPSYPPNLGAVLLSGGIVAISVFLTILLYARPILSRKATLTQGALGVISATALLVWLASLASWGLVGWRI